ncbi:EFR1 family ferrodoxin [Thomasclavelia sp.]
MILYFSGTGNSEYVAKRIGNKINDKVINLFNKIRQCDFTDLYSDQPWVIVAPTYAWRIPRILHEWLKNTKFIGNKDIYFVMTCGGSIGNADKYIKKLCYSKEMNYMGSVEIVMPENYIAMFSTPSLDEALKIIHKAENKIDKIASIIKNKEIISQSRITFRDKINSSIVNSIFYPVFVHAKKFYVTDKCISCGKCVQVCPLNNVTLKNNKPIWGNHCTHCMACICRCPSKAIEYGKHSKGKERYTFPRNI